MEQNAATEPTKVRSLENNVMIRKPLPRLDANIAKKGKVGQPKKFTPVRMKNAINRYFDYCEETDSVPSIKGMMIHMKMYKEAFYKYMEYPEFRDIMEHARLIISNWAETDVYETKGMAAGKIAYMKNVHDWTEKLEQNSTVHQTVTTVEQAKAKIEMLAPRLLELLKTTNIVDQLVIPQKETIIDSDPEETPVLAKNITKVTKMKQSKRVG